MSGYGLGTYGLGLYGIGEDDTPVSTVKPYPAPARAMPLDLRVKISNGAGWWVELNDGRVYRVGDGSFEEQTVTFRRKSATNEFLEGEYVISALRENVTVPLNVWVYGQSAYDLEARRKALTDLLSRPTFQVRRSVDDATTVWNCYASDYTVSSTRPLLHARMCQVRAQLVRDPVEYLIEEI